MKYLMKVELEKKTCNQGDASAKDGELFLKINKSVYNKLHEDEKEMTKSI